MKTVYIARSFIPSKAANSVHVMKICEAFNELCEDFEAIVVESTDKISEDVFSYYGIKNKFAITMVPHKRILKGLYRYYFALKTFSLILKKGVDRLITRDPLVAFLAILFHKKTVLDLHGELAHICGRSYRIIKLDFFRNNKYLKFVMITESLARYYEKKYGVDPQNITVLADGCTLENFEPYAKNSLLMDNEMKLCYAGSFGVGRGYEIIQELAKQDNINCYTIYGGQREDAQKITGEVPPLNIDFKGFIANRDIPEALCNQDILLLPYQNTVIAKGEDTGKVMSPLKLFEAMASGRVIVVSDLPVLREIVDDTNCYFAIADDVLSWKKAIEYISEHKEEAREKAAKAKEDVKQYTWKKRAEKMLQLVE